MPCAVYSPAMDTGKDQDQGCRDQGMGRPASGLAALPALAPVRQIRRPLTVSEYYHAAIGRHPQSHVSSHDVVIFLEGTLGTAGVDQGCWQAALDAVAEVNPGARLRLVGRRQRASWCSDGLPPQLRLIEDCSWSGDSSDGLAALLGERLDLEQGRVAEVIVTRSPQTPEQTQVPEQAPTVRVIFRASHAAMDGMGTLHLMQEVFRALRGEPLLGSNATFTDTDLMRHGPARTVLMDRQARFMSLMGAPQGDERGGLWRRLRVAGPQPNLLPRLAGALVDYGRQHGTGAGLVRIGIPGNLRRHVPELLTTMNFAGMTYVDVACHEDAGIAAIKERLNLLREGNAEMNYRRRFELIRYLPFAWVDRLISVNETNYRTPNLHESAILTVLGSFKKALFSGGGFAAERMCCVPQLENVFVAVSGLQGHFDITVGMPRVLASGGRMAQLCAFLQQALESRD